jgi:hypothetical protein
MDERGCVRMKKGERTFRQTAKLLYGWQKFSLDLVLSV